MANEQPSPNIDRDDNLWVRLPPGIRWHGNHLVGDLILTPDLALELIKVLAAAVQEQPAG